ncbi:MAG: integrase core domain-containing protein [Planctomycetota bacterium]
MGNAYVESMIGHMKAECHNYFWLFISMKQLGRVNGTYMHFHNNFRPHQGKENTPCLETSTGRRPSWRARCGRNS